MSNMNISFGAKIPMSQHNVYDREHNEFVKTTLYEIDAKDANDVKYIKSQKGHWGEIRDDIVKDIAVKHSNIVKGKQNIKPKNKFYSLEISEGKAIG